MGSRNPHSDALQSRGLLGHVTAEKPVKGAPYTPPKLVSACWIIREFRQFAEETFLRQQPPVEARTHLIPNSKATSKRFTAPRAFPGFEAIPDQEQSDGGNGIHSEIEVPWVRYMQDASEGECR